MSEDYIKKLVQGLGGIKTFRKWVLSLYNSNRSSTHLLSPEMLLDEQTDFSLKDAVKSQTQDRYSDSTWNRLTNAVVLYGKEDFDVRDIEGADADARYMRDSSGMSVFIDEDLATEKVYFKDFNNDGIEDARLYFGRSEMAAEYADNGDSLDLTISGETSDGQFFTSLDESAVLG